MEELSREKVRPLLEALGDPSAPVRLAALRALVRLFLAPQVWMEISDRLTGLLRKLSPSESLAGRTLEGLPAGEVIGAAVYVPTRAVRERLYDLLGAGDAGLRREVAEVLARARDPRAAPGLLPELDSPYEEGRARAAELLSLLDLPPGDLGEIGKAFQREKDGEARFWLALALARAGEPAPIDTVLGELSRGRIELRSAWGDPQVLRDKLARRGPFPEEVVRRLRDLAGDESLSPEVRDICQSLLPGPEEPLAPPPPPRPADPEAEERAEASARRFAQTDEVDEDLFRELRDTDLLTRLPPQTSSRMVNAMFKRSVREFRDALRAGKADIGNVLAGNAVVAAVEPLARANAYTPDLQGLFESASELRLEEGQEGQRVEDYPLHNQIAWAASRAGVDKVLDGLSSRMEAEGERGKIAAAELIAAAARYAPTRYPPIYGGAAGAEDLQPPASASIDYEETRASAVYRERKTKARARPPAGPGEGRRKAPPPKRVVNSGFAPQSRPDRKADPRMPLQTGGAYYFWLEIGRPQARSIEEKGEDIPPVPADSRLTVALFGFADGLEITAGADTGELTVQEGGQVTVLRQPLESPPPSRHLKRRLFFPVRAPLRPGACRMRCNLYRGQVLLQSRLITAQVAERPAPAARGEKALRSTLDYTLARTLDPVNLNRLEEQRLSILLNANGDGTHSFHLFGLGGAAKFKQDDVRFEEGELQGMIEQARGALRIASWEKAQEWREGLAYRYKDRKRNLPRLKADLSNLARWGYEFYTLVQARLAGGEEAVAALEGMLAEPGYIQIAMKESPRYLLPAAMIYDYPLDTGLEQHGLCAAFEEAFRRAGPLEGEACFRGRCPSRDDLTVVCPGGFWGFRHFLGMPLSVEKGPDAPAVIPLQAPLRMAVGVATDLKLLTEHAQALRRLRAGLAWDYADTRAEVFRHLKGSPHVVYFYCHGGLLRDAPYLQVGSQEAPGRILPSNLTAYKIGWDDPRPLVFLNGCHTTAVQPLQALDLVGRFVAKCRGAGVIGTEITIFEELATVFAEEFFRLFFAGRPVGEAVRSARLKLLGEGNPLGLVYIPFALGGLKLAGPAG